MEPETVTIGSITFGPVNAAPHPEVMLIMPHPHPLELPHAEIARLRVENASQRRQLAIARQWYDDEHPAEDGHDQVYPWDHV